MCDQACTSSSACEVPVRRNGVPVPPVSLSGDQGVAYVTTRRELPHPQALPALCASDVGRAPGMPAPRATSTSRSPQASGKPAITPAHPHAKHPPRIRAATAKWSPGRVDQRFINARHIREPAKGIRPSSGDAPGHRVSRDQPRPSCGEADRWTNRLERASGLWWGSRLDQDRGGVRFHRPGRGMNALLGNSVRRCEPSGEAVLLGQCNGRAMSREPVRSAVDKRRKTGV